MTYRTFKYKYKHLIEGERVSDSGKSYGVVVGTVQFDPKREREVNGQTVCDVTIKAANLPPNADGSQKLVSITIWPEFAVAWGTVKKGDYIAADGEIRTTTGQNDDGSPRTYINWSPSAIFVGSAEVRQPRQVVQAPVTQPVAAVAVAQPLAVAQPVAAQPVAAVAQPAAAPTPSVF